MATQAGLQARRGLVRYGMINRRDFLLSAAITFYDHWCIFLGQFFFIFNFNVSAEKALLERRKLIDRLPSNVSNASQHELILLIKQRLRSSRDEQIACSSEFEC
jgi:hypothetical protein